MLYVPYLFSRTPRAARDPDGRRVAEPGARAVTTRPASSRCSRRRRSSSAAARAASARRRSRRRPRSARRAGSAARCSCSRSTRPSGSPTRSGSRASATSRSRCRPRRSRPPGSRSAASSGPRCSTPSSRGTRSVLRHAPDEETAYRILDNRHVRQHHRALRAEPRLHRDGAALRDPRDRQVRPHHHRHARRPGTRSTSSTRRSGWPSSSAAGCCAGSRCRTGSAASAARA